MATKKTEKIEEIKEETAVEETVVEIDPWQDMVEITLPRHPKSEQNFQFVAVNDRRFQVPRNGKPTLVPRPVYEVLMNSADMKDYAAERKDALSEMSEN